MKKKTKDAKRKRRPSNPIAKDLRTPKYKQRIVPKRVRFDNPPELEWEIEI